IHSMYWIKNNTVSLGYLWSSPFNYVVNIILLSKFTMNKSSNGVNLKKILLKALYSALYLVKNAALILSALDFRKVNQLSRSLKKCQEFQQFFSQTKAKLLKQIEKPKELTGAKDRTTVTKILKMELKCIILSILTVKMAVATNMRQTLIYY
ncbi:hypothetical protein L9F63_009720, partial [Diploptera punctata]